MNSKLLPAYLYQQYADDKALAAIFGAHNERMQGVLDWCANTGMALADYTQLHGETLDFIGVNVYGFKRPFIGGKDAAYDVGRYDVAKYDLLGLANLASDDTYKRVITWHLHQGDVDYFSIPVLKQKIKRFLVGKRGGDIDLSISPNIPFVKVTQPSGREFDIRLKSSALAIQFEACLISQALVTPFQYKFNVFVE